MKQGFVACLWLGWGKDSCHIQASRDKEKGHRKEHSHCNLRPWRERVRESGEETPGLPLLYFWISCWDLYRPEPAGSHRTCSQQRVTEQSEKGKKVNMEGQKVNT